MYYISGGVFSLDSISNVKSNCFFGFSYSFLTSSIKVCEYLSFGPCLKFMTQKSQQQCTKYVGGFAAVSDFFYTQFIV